MEGQRGGGSGGVGWAEGRRSQGAVKVGAVGGIVGRKTRTVLLPDGRHSCSAITLV